MSLPGPVTVTESWKRDEHCKRKKQIPMVTPQQSVQVRTIRIICDDPYATESNTDDESEKCVKKVKKFTCEIKIPLRPELTKPAVVESESSCQDSNNKTKNRIKRQRRRNVLPNEKQEYENMMLAVGNNNNVAAANSEKSHDVSLSRSQLLSRSQSLHNMSSSDETDSVLSHTSLSSVLVDTNVDTSTIANEKFAFELKEENIPNNVEVFSSNFDIDIFEDLPLPIEWLAPEDLGNDLELCNEFNILGGNFCDLDDLNFNGLKDDTPSGLPDSVFSLGNGNDEISSFMNDLAPLNVAACP